MICLSLRENEDIAKEADFLCDLITSRATELRQAHWGRKVSIDGLSFQLYQKDRNIIYRIQSAVLGNGNRVSLNRRNFFRTRSKGRIFHWFLKMPRQKRPKMIEREIIGAETVRQALRNHQNYYHMNAIRASTDDAYILYSEIPGKPLHLAFYRECLAPIPKEIKRYLIPSTLLNKTFRYFGDALARFHTYKIQNKEILPEHPLPDGGLEREEIVVYPLCLPKAKKHPADGLHEIVDKLSGSDAISRAIFRWVEKQQELSNDHSIVHGNLRLDNVIVHDGKICLIDFENCGYGPIYHDLSWMCCLILLTRALPLFPWRYAQLALKSFIDGYKNISDYDREILFQFVTMRLCDFYIGTYYSGHVRAKIAGIPVSRKRFQKLIMAMIEGKFDSVLDGMKL